MLTYEPLTSYLVVLSVCRMSAILSADTGASSMDMGRLPNRLVTVEDAGAAIHTRARPCCSRIIHLLLFKVKGSSQGLTQRLTLIYYKKVGRKNHF